MLVGLISYLSLVFYFRKHPEKLKGIGSLYKNEKMLNNSETILSSFVITKTQLNNYRVELYNSSGNILLFSNYFHSTFIANEFVKRVISGITCAEFVQEHGINGLKYYLIKIDSKTILFSTEFNDSCDQNVDIELIKKEVQGASKLDVTIKGTEPLIKKYRVGELELFYHLKEDDKYYFSYMVDKKEIVRTIAHNHKNDLTSLKNYLTKITSLLDFEVIKLGNIYLLTLLDNNKNIIMLGRYSNNPCDLFNEIQLLEKRI